MSSSSIMASIRKKEIEIQSCQAEILNLETKLEEQQVALDKFIVKVEEFEDLINGKMRKVSAVTEYAKSTLADKFGAQMETVFNTTTWAQQKQNMTQISDNMDTEIRGTESDLDSERQRLIRLQNELSNLQAQYQNELREEQKAAAANN